jgi:DNA-binding transcriptional MerR regulator
MPTTEQVAHAAGITYRQLDHWTRRGYLRPVVVRNGFGSGQGGRSRDWPAAEVAVACRMARLIAAGLTPEAAAELARAPGRHVLAPGITIEVSP